MIEHVFQRVLFLRIAQDPRIGLWCAAFMMLGGIGFTIATWRNERFTGGAPQRLTLAAALAHNGDLWVTLTDVRWDCAHAVIQGARMRVVVGDGTRWVVAEDVANAVCDGSRPVTGRLRHFVAGAISGNLYLDERGEVRVGWWLVLLLSALGLVMPSAARALHRSWLRGELRNFR